MAKPRDFQRGRVYKSERTIDAWDADRMSLDECKDFIRAVYESQWFRARTWRYAIRVGDGRGRRRPCGHPSRGIKLPRWGRTPIIICHELAHVLAPMDSSWHGREFCGWYLALVRHFIGRADYDQLRQAFRDHGVKVGPMPKPKRTPVKRDVFIL